LGLNPAPTAIASIASAPMEYKTFRSMASSPFCLIALQGLLRLETGAGGERQRGKRRCGVQQVLPPGQLRSHRKPPHFVYGGVCRLPVEPASADRFEGR
jgi:hypothetical protein